MADVCMNGPGHYLGTDQTLSRMQSDNVYPTLGDRTSPKEWAEIGKPVLVEKATALKEDILGKPSSVPLDPTIDAMLREKYTIHVKPV